MGVGMLSGKLISGSAAAPKNNGYFQLAAGHQTSLGCSIDYLINADKRKVESHKFYDRS